MSRFFGGKVDSKSFPNPKRDFLHSPLWEPHFQGAMQPGAYTSKFPLLNDTKYNLYTMVNRQNTNLTGQQLWMKGPLPPSAVVYDCYRGVELKTETPVAPPQPHLPESYNGYFGSNAFTGRGGDNIDQNPVQNLTVAKCAVSVPWSTNWAPLYSLCTLPSALTSILTCVFMHFRVFPSCSTNDIRRLDAMPIRTAAALHTYPRQPVP
jgi:hypothetical protein